MRLWKIYANILDVSMVKNSTKSIRTWRTKSMQRTRRRGQDARDERTRQRWPRQRCPTHTCWWSASWWLICDENGRHDDDRGRPEEARAWDGTHRQVSWWVRRKRQCSAGLWAHYSRKHAGVSICKYVHRFLLCVSTLGLLLGLYGRYFYIVPFTVSFNCFYVYILYLEHLNVQPFFCCSCSTLTTEQQKESVNNNKKTLRRMNNNKKTLRPGTWTV